MNFHIITLFPDAFSSYLGKSILKRAVEDKKIMVKFYNPRDFEKDPKWRIDQKPYGGGPGMVLRAEPVMKAIEKALKNAKVESRRWKVEKKDSRKLPSTLHPPLSKIIWFSPSGKQFTNEYAKKIAKKYSDIVLVCGRYEGIDARVKKVFSTKGISASGGKVEDISVGPFVLTGGELPAEIFIDVVSRQILGVLGNYDSLEESRISSSNVYTRPEVFTYKGKKYHVPKILLSGHRARIEEWKRKQK